MPKENKAAFIILGLLNHEDLSGYDIKKQIDMGISRFWEVGYGQIYPSLKSLVDAGHIVKKDTETDKGPEKIIYSITKSGREALMEWLRIPEMKESAKYDILLKLYFGNMLSTQDNIDRIQLFEKKHLGNQEMMRFFKGNLEKVLDEDKDHLYYYLTVLFGEKMYDAYVSWAKEAKTILEKYKEDNSEN